MLSLACFIARAHSKGGRPLPPALARSLVKMRVYLESLRECTSQRSAPFDWSILATAPPSPDEVLEKLNEKMMEHLNMDVLANPHDTSSARPLSP